MLFSEHVAKGETAAPRRPFDLHLLLFNFAISSWRPYLVHLAEEIHQHVSPIVQLGYQRLTKYRQIRSCWQRLRAKDLSVSVGAVTCKD